MPSLGEILPRPRLIICHGDIENETEAHALDSIATALESLMRHGFIDGYRRAGGNDWTGWHTTDADGLQGLAAVADGMRIRYPHWKISLEL